VLFSWASALLTTAKIRCFYVVIVPERRILSKNESKNTQKNASDLVSNTLDLHILLR